MKHLFSRLIMISVYCIALSSEYTALAVQTPNNVGQPTTETITSLPAQLFQQAFSQCQNGGLSFGYTFTGGEYQMQCASIAEIQSKLSISNYPATCPPNQIAYGISGDKQFLMCRKSVENTCGITPGQVTELNSLVYGSQFLTDEQWCNQTQLDLPNKNLNRIPSGVKKLSKLKTLNLSWNSLTSVDSFIGNLKQLEELNLAYNPSITSLPSSIINLKKLKKFSLSGLRNSSNECTNRTPITNLPDEFTQLSALQDLQISCTGLTELPTNFRMLRSLSGNLSLTENQLSTLPGHLDELTNVTMLNLSLNQITTLNGSNIENMTGLKILLLKGNRITNLPNTFNNLTSLEQLELHGNQFITLSGSNIENLPNLQYLNLSYNPLTSLPENFGNLQSLRTFALESTNITELPPSFNHLNIKTFQVCMWNNNSLPCNRNTGVLIQNYISGGSKFLTLRNNLLRTLPEYSESFSGFTSINLDGNRIAIIPQTILNNSSIKKLILTNNNLSNLPTNTEYFQGEEIDLRNNSLTELPLYIGQLSHLKKLSLQYNALNSLPNEINQLTNLEELCLGDYQGYGRGLHNNIATLPESFGSGNLVNLKKLDLSYNPIISLPESIGGIGENLQELYLVGSTRTLTSIPNTIEKLTHLTTLNLNPQYDYWDNDSTLQLGALATRFGGDQKVLRKMNVTTTGEGVEIEGAGVPGNNGKIKIIVGLYACNLLQSEIAELNTAFGSGMTDVQWCNSTTLDFSNRLPKLTTIPKGITKLINLQTLNLSNNQISSLSYYDLPNSSNFKKLDISHNLLTNRFQDDCSYASILSGYLRELDVSYNQLTSFSMWCTRSYYLESFNASHNNIASWFVSPRDSGNPLGFRALQKLDLSNNQLTNWDMDNIRYPVIKELNLSDNNINLFNKTINTNTGILSLDLQNNSDLRSLSALYFTGAMSSGSEDHIAKEDYSVAIYSSGDGSPIEITSTPNYTNGCGLTAADVEELNNTLTSVGNGPGKRYPSAKSASEWCNITEMDLSSIGGAYEYHTYNSLPNSIGKLKNLEVLDLTNNKLRSLPESFTGLTSLKVLSLRNNAFTGTLQSIIGSLTNLQKLYIDNNANRGMTYGIYNLKNEYINTNYTGRNRFQYLPDNFGALTRLREFTAEGNELLGLPESFGNIGASLTVLTLNNNRLQYLPPDFGQSLSMTELNISDNDLTQLPPLFGSGGGFTRLTTLKLRNNRITSLPSSFGGMLNLQKLYLDQAANLNGEGPNIPDRRNNLIHLPDSFSNLTNIDTLELSGNRLEDLPMDFGNLTKLQRLDLNNQRLRSLPESIGKLVNLSHFYLDNNQLTTFPNSFTGLTSMRYFSAVNNHDDGGNKTLTSVGDFFPIEAYYLNSVSLSNNAITTLPDSIGGSAGYRRDYLFTIGLDNNRLTSLPDGFWRLYRLTNLDLSNNNLQSLSGGIVNLTNLQSLSLRENPAFSTLPENIGQLRNTLRSLDLYNGSIQRLPDSLSQLTNLYYLNLQLNNLQSLPENIGNLNQLSSLLIQDNELMSLPSSISNMNLITELNLTSNSLTSLPDEISNMTQLSRINISGNAGFNRLPENLGRLSNLSYLTLTDTAIDKLPSSFDQLNNKLVELNLSHTGLGNLSGLFKSETSANTNQENITTDGNKITITSQGNGTTLQIMKE